MLATNVGLGGDAADHVDSDQDDDSDSSPLDVEGDDGAIRSDKASSISSDKGLSRSPVRNDICARVRVRSGLSSSLWWTRVLRREGNRSAVILDRGTGRGVAWETSLTGTAAAVRGLDGGVASDASAEEGV